MDDEQITQENKKAPVNTQVYIIPVSIVIAGALIAGAVFLGGERAPKKTALEAAPAGAQDDPSGSAQAFSAANIRNVDKDDHVRGDKDAEIAVVEFSDFQCPFCARMHPTLTRLIEEYGGRVKWVYRHFPLSSIHSEATASAVASECVADLAGNEAFWKFADGIFADQQNIGAALYADLAGQFGISGNDLAECMKNEKMKKKVAEDLQDAANSGGRGTPYVVVLNKNNEPFPFSGALPYEQVKAVIEQVLSKNN